MTTATDQPLFAVKHHDAELRVIDVDSIDVPDPLTLDAREVEQLASNIARVGLIHQPVLMKNGRRYTVITGRRRVAALQLLARQERDAIAAKREAGESVDDEVAGSTVECYVRTERKTSAEDVAALVLSENAMRSANVLGEVRSINTLVAAGHDVTSIAKATGQHVSWIRHRLILNKLVPAAFDLFVAGRMRFETAQQLARLDAKQQQRAVDRFTKKAASDAVLSLSDISVAKSKPVAKLPDEMFAPMQAVDPVVAASQRARDRDPEQFDRDTATLAATADSMPSDTTPLDLRAVGNGDLSLSSEALSYAQPRDSGADPIIEREYLTARVAEELAQLQPVDRLSVIAGALDVLAELMPDIASRTAVKRARTRALVGRDALRNEEVCDARR